MAKNASWTRMFFNTVNWLETVIPHESDAFNLMSFQLAKKLAIDRNKFCGIQDQAIFGSFSVSYILSS